LTFSKNSVIIYIEKEKEKSMTILMSFTTNELDAIEDALDYLLDAELLPENGYTDEVVETIASTLEKVRKVTSALK